MIRQNTPDFSEAAFVNSGINKAAHDNRVTKRSELTADFEVYAFVGVLRSPTYESSLKKPEEFILPAFYNSILKSEY
ncbi:hypothetical protein ACH42_15200 [Endozoicomonas sp. (ex Bugula neritina AB1)]|nr:hypothetical protein ACH42_15200 [Endozoicomonas sp. (ex Bugula neritina AB1)]